MLPRDVFRKRKLSALFSPARAPNISTAQRRSHRGADSNEQPALGSDLCEGETGLARQHSEGLHQAMNDGAALGTRGCAHASGSASAGKPAERPRRDWWSALIIALTPVLVLGALKLAYLDMPRWASDLRLAYAAEQTTPWQAFRTLMHAEPELRMARYCALSLVGRTADCPTPAVETAVRLSSAHYLSAALAAGEPEALLHVLNAPDSSSDAAFKPLATEKLMEVADSEASASDNGLLLVAAARVLAHGPQAPRNVDRVHNLLQRAWAMGESQAADELAQLSLRQGRIADAREWAQRCADTCKPSPSVALAVLS